MPENKKPDPRGSGDMSKYDREPFKTPDQEGYVGLPQPRENQGTVKPPKNPNEGKVG